MKNIIKLQRRNIFTVLAVVISYSISAQDVRFTQMLANPLTLNPAMMGLNPDLKFTLQYRNQWGSIDKGYSTASFTAQAPVYINQGRDKLDIGFNALNDQAGAFNTLNLSLAVGYNVQVSELSHINFSIMGGFIQKSLNTTNLSFDEQYIVGAYSASNPNNELVLNKMVNYADISFGTMWYCSPVKVDVGKLHTFKAYLGASAFHLNTPPNESFSGGTGNLPMRFSCQGGIKIVGENKLDITPNVIVNSQQGNNNVAAGLLADYRFDSIAKLTLGVWFRTKDAIAFSIGFSHKIFALTYSYDVVGTSPISYSASRLNAHELTLSLKFNHAEKKGIKVIPAFF
jgi:type IX secretion system PorP/SprF family membrane protein